MRPSRSIAFGLGLALYAMTAHADTPSRVDPDTVEEEQRALIEECIDAENGITGEMHSWGAERARVRRDILRVARDIVELEGGPLSVVLEEAFEYAAPNGVGPNNYHWYGEANQIDAGSEPFASLREFVPIGSDGINDSFLYMIPHSFGVCLDDRCTVQQVVSNPTEYLGSQTDEHARYFELGPSGFRMCLAGLEHSESWRAYFDDIEQADERVLERLTDRYNSIVDEMRSEIDTQRGQLDAWRNRSTQAEPAQVTPPRTLEPAYEGSGEGSGSPAQ